MVLGIIMGYHFMFLSTLESTVDFTKFTRQLSNFRIYYNSNKDQSKGGCSSYVVSKWNTDIEWRFLGRQHKIV